METSPVKHVNCPHISRLITSCLLFLSLVCSSVIPAIPSDLLAPPTSLTINLQTISGNQDNTEVLEQKTETWIEKNYPELVDKLLVTLSMEGNIPEFEGYLAQDANTKGGLGIHFGDKLEGLADIGMNVIGCQPGYGKIFLNNQIRNIDYQELVREGIIQPILVGDDAIEVYAWGEDPNLKQRGQENPLIKVEVYCVNRGGTPLFLFVSDAFDFLYDYPQLHNETEKRIHRFTQEIVFGKAVKEFLKKQKLIPHIIHLNEAHTVVAAAQVDTEDEIAEIFREDEAFDKTAIIYAVHTNKRAGLEQFDPHAMHTDPNRMFYTIGLPARRALIYRSKFLSPDGRVDFCHCAAKIADVINAVSEEQAPLVVTLFKKMYGDNFPIEVESVLNGSGRYWVNKELLDIIVKEKEPTQEELWEIHEKAKKNALEEIKKLTGIELDQDKQTVWLIRRLVPYKSQYDMLRFIIHIKCADKDICFTREKLRFLWKRDIPEYDHLFSEGTVDRVLDNIFKRCSVPKDGNEVVFGLGQQVVVGGPAYVDYWVQQFNQWMNIKELKGRFVYIPDQVTSNIKLLKLQALGSDVLLNYPGPLDEACGTSTQRSALNGGIIITINGAGDKEWITNFDEITDEGSGFFIGSYTKQTVHGIEPDLDAFIHEGPADILMKSSIASQLYYIPGKERWKKRMLNTFRAAHKKVTATHMEMRYAPLYAKALRKQSNSHIIDELVLRDMCDTKKNISGLKNALERLPYLAQTGIKYTVLIGLMKHSGSPYAVEKPFELDPRAGTEEELRNFINAANTHGLKVLIDWFANMNISKTSSKVNDYPQRFLFTNVSDGNYFPDEKDSFLVRGKDINIYELRNRIYAGAQLIEYVKKHDIPPDRTYTFPDSNKTVRLIPIRENNDLMTRRNKINSLCSHEPFFVFNTNPHDLWTPLFIVSATDLERFSTGYPRRFEDLAQPDLDHEENIREGIEIGKYYLRKGIHGFRIDAALSFIRQRIEENWGYIPLNNFADNFIAQMRLVKPDCFFLFEAYEFQSELLKLADYTDCAVLDWEPRERFVDVLCNPSQTHQKLQLFLQKRAKMPAMLRRKLVAFGPLHDDMAYHPAIAQLSYTDRFLTYFFFMFLDQYVHIFNGEEIGKTHAFHHDINQTKPVPSIEEGDESVKKAIQVLFNCRLRNPLLNIGAFQPLNVKSAPDNQRHIAIARYNHDEIIIGVINVSHETKWETIFIEALLNQLIEPYERETTIIKKSNLKIDRDHFEWISDKPGIMKPADLKRHGLTVNNGPRGCELIRLQIDRQRKKPTIAQLISTMYLQRITAIMDVDNSL